MCDMSVALTTVSGLSLCRHVPACEVRRARCTRSESRASLRQPSFIAYKTVHAWKANSLVQVLYCRVASA